MQISSSSWHARVYHWWIQKAWETTPRDNLCLYVWGVLLWAPLVWLFGLGRIGPLRVAFVSWTILLGTPLIFVYNWKILSVLLVIYATIVIIGAVVTLMVVGEQLRPYKYPKPIESFATVLREYRKAVHDRICPFIEFK